MIDIQRILKHPIHLVAFGFGAGLSPKAPGTFGTVVGVILYLILRYLPLPYYLLVTVILTLSAFWICDWSAKDIGVHDYPGIVLDEIVAFLWVMIAVPLSWWTLLLGFLLFRLFDVWKPWPIRLLDQRIGGGVGIVVDDLLAAVYSWVCLQAIIFLQSFFFPQQW